MSPSPFDPPEDAEGRVWDAVVIGTGAGGAPAGFNLARLGKSVLFVERGKLLHRDPTVRRGVAFPGTKDPSAAIDHGWWPHPFWFRDHDEATPEPRRLAVGCGAGGSTAQFNGVLERFRPADFTPRRYFADVPDTTLPEAWPISYDELEPYYRRAETLFRVRGEPDPLAPAKSDLLEPPPMEPGESALVDGLRGVGLHPYRNHYALDLAAGCVACPGTLCARACRNDAARICLDPAIERHGARILTNCRAIRLEETGRTVTRLVCDWGGRPIALRARQFVLAAGAFLTPALLQRSASVRHPDGLANSSGLVGRNLMMHAASHVFLRLKADPSTPPAMGYGLSLNDFYIHDGVKMGNFHAHPAPVHEMSVNFAAQSTRWLQLVPWPARIRIAAMAPRLDRAWTPFSAILEDLPYDCNHVAAKSGSDEDVVYTYRYPEELRRRAGAMVDLLRQAAAPRFDSFPLKPIGGLNGGHGCGTCRFGEDPRTSVLDRDNRAHDLDNLYVVDASFFPSSAGINPSLTIIANSLRASDRLAERL